MRDFLRKAIKLIQKGKNQPAIKILKSVEKNYGSHAIIDHLIGSALLNDNDIENAKIYLKKAYSKDNNNIETISNLAACYRNEGAFSTAYELYRRIIEIDPKNEESLSFIGYYNVQHEKNYQKAIFYLEKLLTLNSNHFYGTLNICAAYRAVGNNRVALQLAEKLLEANPNSFDAKINLAKSYAKTYRKGEAKNLYLKLQEEYPESDEVKDGLSDLYKSEYDFTKALKTLSEKLTSSKDQNYKDLQKFNYLNKFFFNLELTESIDNHVKNYVKLTPIEEIDDIDCFESLASGFSSDLVFKLAKSKNLKHEPKNREFSIKAQNQKIKIGYVSYDFFNHATSYLIAELFELHDRNKFEIYIFSHGPNKDAETRDRIIKSADKFIDIEKIDEFEAADLIHAEQIDILIDLKGHTANNRINIFAQRPAPIQVNYLGYPGTMGTNFHDYIIADKFIIPESNIQFYSEKVAYLPNTYQPNDSKKAIDKAKTREEYGLPADKFVFCSFNIGYKVSYDRFKLWMKILQAVPNSVFWMLELSGSAATNFLALAEKHGIDRSRFINAPFADLPAHLARVGVADLFLDTYPVVAHTTASDALWAGLPLLTMAGETFVSRVAGSLLTTMGISELITYSPEEFYNKAIELANSPQILKEIRNKIQKGIKESAVYDTKRYARNIESAYSYMYEQYRNGQSPESFEIIESM